jgi:hypothetical protein
MLPPLSDLRVVVPDHVVARAVDGLTVLLDVVSGRTFSFDDVGTRAWLALTESPTAATALERLQAEYAAAPGVIERDFIALLDRLAASRLVLLQSDRS